MITQMRDPTPSSKTSLKWKHSWVIYRIRFQSYLDQRQQQQQQQMGKECQKKERTFCCQRVQEEMGCQRGDSHQKLSLEPWQLEPMLQKILWPHLHSDSMRWAMVGMSMRWWSLLLVFFCNQGYPSRLTSCIKLLKLQSKELHLTHNALFSLAAGALSCSQVSEASLRAEIPSFHLSQEDCLAAFFGVSRFTNESRDQGYGSSHILHLG